MTSFSLPKAAAVLALGLALEAGFLLHAMTPVAPSRAAAAAAFAARPGVPTPAPVARCPGASPSSRCG